MYIIVFHQIETSTNKENAPLENTLDRPIDNA